MYKVSAKQLVSVALFSALLAGIIVACAVRALDPAPVAVEPVAIADPTVATDEQNNIEIYRGLSPGVVNMNLQGLLDCMRFAICEGTRLFRHSQGQF